MSDSNQLRPAKPDDIADALKYALMFHGRRRVRQADDIMASIVADRLVEHLERCGFVIMRRPSVSGGGALYAEKPASGPEGG